MFKRETSRRIDLHLFTFSKGWRWQQIILFNSQVDSQVLRILVRRRKEQDGQSTMYADKKCFYIQRSLIQAPYSIVDSKPWKVCLYRHLTSYRLLKALQYIRPHVSNGDPVDVVQWRNARCLQVGRVSFKDFDWGTTTDLSILDALWWPSFTI